LTTNVERTKLTLFKDSPVGVYTTKNKSAKVVVSGAHKSGRLWHAHDIKIQIMI